MVYAIVFFCVFFVLFGIAVKFDGKVEKLSSKDKIPLLSMRAKPCKIMFFSLLGFGIFWGGVAGSLYDEGFFYFFGFLIWLLALVVWFSFYFRWGNVNFYEDEIEIIPFLGKKKIYKYNKIYVIFGVAAGSWWDIGPGILIINKENPSRLDRVFNSSTIAPAYHKNPPADILIAEEILTGKVQNIHYPDKYGWKEWKTDTLRRIKNERK